MRAANEPSALGALPLDRQEVHRRGERNGNQDPEVAQVSGYEHEDGRDQKDPDGHEPRDF